MSLRFPSPTSPSDCPSGATMRRAYGASGRVCTPAMNILYVRSIGGRGERGDVRAGDRARLRLGADLSPLPSPFAHSGFRYSHIPSFPPSRPKPDSRYPPNPDAASNRLVQLIQTTPALIFGATSSPRLMFSVHTLAASP